MTSLRERHQELGRQLLDRRAEGTITEQEDSNLTEEMGKLWWAMPDEDHEWIRKQPAPYTLCKGGCMEWVVTSDDPDCTCKECGGRSRRG